MPTDLSAVVTRVNLSHPELLQYNSPASCGEFLQRVCGEPECKAERVGLLSKSSSENGYTFPNGKRCSLDVLAWPNGERVDCISSAGGHPAPGGPTWQVIPRDQWRPTNVYVDVSTWPLYDSGTPDLPAPGLFTIGWGWFCWMRAWADWTSECQQNEAWIIGEINPSVYRVMLAVEGLSHGTPDPWRDAGVWIDATWEDRFKKMLDRIGGQSRKAHCTVYGGRNQTPTEDSRKKFHDRIVKAAEGRWEAIRSFECMNEYNVNRWTEAEVRSTGRDLRSKLPAGFKLSLSSPDMAHGGSGTTTNEEMQASFDKLYGGDGAGANECTIHTMRDGGKWSDPFAFNIFYPHLPKINNEPPGPGTSAGGETTDAADVQKDLTATKGAGWPMYVGHAEWCPWNGHLPTEYYNGYREVRYVKDLPHMPAVAVVLRGTPVTPPVPVTDRLHAGDSLLPGQFLQSPTSGHRLNLQSDGNLVSYDTVGTPIWASGTYGTVPGNLQMQGDGNLVLYAADGTPVWASHTSGDQVMALFEDGGILRVLKPLWSSNA